MAQEVLPKVDVDLIGKVIAVTRTKEVKTRL